MRKVLTTGEMIDALDVDEVAEIVDTGSDITRDMIGKRIMNDRQYYFYLDTYTNFTLHNGLRKYKWVIVDIED